ncbi:MAG: hypothetical protein R3C12_06550 [Planctomycetaceae bacterium]
MANIFRPGTAHGIVIGGGDTQMTAWGPAHAMAASSLINRGGPRNPPANVPAIILAAVAPHSSHGLRTQGSRRRLQLRAKSQQTLPGDPREYAIQTIEFWDEARLPE